MRVAILAPSDIVGNHVGGTSTLLPTMVALPRCQLHLLGVRVRSAEGPTRDHQRDAFPKIHVVGELDPSSRVPSRMQRALPAFRVARDMRRWAPRVLYVDSASGRAADGSRAAGPAGRAGAREARERRGHEAHVPTILHHAATVAAGTIEQPLLSVCEHGSGPTPVNPEPDDMTAAGGSPGPRWQLSPVAVEADAR